MKEIERRTFLKGAAAVSAFTILSPRIAFGSQNNSAFRIGMIGCGNRGTGVLTAMSKNTNANIIALADNFDDKLATTRKNLGKYNTDKGFADIQKENIYQGSKAYQAHYSGGVFIKGENARDSGIVKSGADLSPQQIALGTSISSLDDADQNKGRSFINSIETGNYLNQLVSGCETTLSAILGREAALQQKVVSWE